MLTNLKNIHYFDKNKMAVKIFLGEKTKKKKSSDKSFKRILSSKKKCSKFWHFFNRCEVIIQLNYRTRKKRLIIILICYEFKTDNCFQGEFNFFKPLIRYWLNFSLQLPIKICVFFHGLNVRFNFWNCGLYCFTRNVSA